MISAPRLPSIASGSSDSAVLSVWGELEDSGVGTAGDKGYMYPTEKHALGTSSVIVPCEKVPDCSKNCPDWIVFVVPRDLKAVPTPLLEEATTRMVEEESKLGAASSSVATPESEWESSVGRSEGALVAETIAGTMLMVWGVLANLAVLMITDWRIRRASRLSSFYFLLGHLAVADLIILGVFLPVETGRMPMESQGLETSWTAENELGCKGVGFLHAFAGYLSSFILISIILDRYWAFMRPLDAYTAVDRARAMALVAYIAAILVSLPEAKFYHVEASPFDTSTKMCTAYGSWRSLEFELMYAVFKTLLVYGIPLITILTLCPRMMRHTRTIMERENFSANCSIAMNSNRWAKLRAIQLCLTIAPAFLILWAPYHVWVLWSWIDVDSQFSVSGSAVKVTQFLACANSCVNPILHMHFRFWWTQAGRRAERIVTQTTWL